MYQLNTFLLIGSLKVTLYSVSLLLSFCVTCISGGWNEFESPAISGSPKYCMVKTVCKQSCKEDGMLGTKHMNSPACNPHPPSNFAGLQHSEGDTYGTLYASMLNASKSNCCSEPKLCGRLSFHCGLTTLCTVLTCQWRNW